MSDPKGEGLGNLGDMFKNFEKISKEQETKTPSSEEDPFAKLFGSMGQPDENFDEAQMMKMFQGLMGDLGKPDSGDTPPQMEEIFK